MDTQDEALVVRLLPSNTSRSPTRLDHILVEKYATPSWRMASMDVRRTTTDPETQPVVFNQRDNYVRINANSIYNTSKKMPTEEPPPCENLPPMPPPPPAIEQQQQQRHELRLDEVHEVASRHSDGKMDSDAPQYAFSISGSLLRSIKELVDMHDKVVDLRIGMDIHENNYDAQWKHTSNHLDNFLKAASTFMGNVAKLADDKSNVPDIMKTWGRLQTSIGHWQKWQSRGKHQQQDLTTWEGMLCEKEEHVYHQLRRIMAGTAISSSPSLYSAHKNMAFESVAASQAASNPMEHDYYDKLGDLGLLRDRIYNFDADQKLRRQRLELAIKNQDFSAALREQQSFEEYVITRQELLREYFMVKQELEALRENCGAAGIDVQIPDVTSFLDLSHHGEQLPVSVPSRALKISGKWNPDLFLLFGELDKRNRILRWRDEVRKAHGASKLVLATMGSIDDTPLGSNCGKTAQQEQLEIAPGPSPKGNSSPMVADMAEVEEGPLFCNMMDERNPTLRRYSEPNMAELWRKMVPPTQILMNLAVSKSEGAGEIIDIPRPEGVEHCSHIARSTPSQRLRLRPKTR